MAGWGEVISSIGNNTGSTLMLLIWIVLILGIVVLVVGLIFGFWYFKKRWNLRVEIKLVRGNGKAIIGEWGKGRYDSQKGVVFIKREGEKIKKVPMPIFDIKRYLQGTDIMTVIQLGPEDYRPVLNDSWTERVVEYIDEDTGKEKKLKESIMDIKIDDGLNKAWKSAWDNAAKKAYSLSTFFSQFQTPIAIGIVIIALFVGFAIIWTRLGNIC